MDHSANLMPSLAAIASTNANLASMLIWPAIPTRGYPRLILRLPLFESTFATSKLSSEPQRAS